MTSPNENDTAELQRIEALTQRAYDLVGARYHEMFGEELDGKPYDRELLDRFAALFNPGSVVYDMGCGPSGHVTKYLHDKGVYIIGIDISGRCTDLAAEIHPDIEFHRMNMRELTLADESIDGILAYYSIIHTPKRELGRILREFRRVLKVGGRLLVAVKEGDDEGFLDGFLDHPVRIWFTNFREFEVRDFLQSHGFAILSLESRNAYPDEIPIARIYAVAEKI